MSRRFPELWEILFLVSDDIKEARPTYAKYDRMQESVRVAGSGCVKTMKRVSLRYCVGRKDSHVHLAAILPVILDKGLASPVEEIRVLSLSMLTQLTREGGAALRAHLGILVPCLLRSLSELEPALVNYLAVRADEDQLASLDSARMAAAKTSPSMDALRACLRVLTPQDLRDLCGTLCELLRSSGTGLATRTGTATFVQAITSQIPRELIAAGQPTSDKLMKALESGLTDRNATIRRQFASTLGSLAKFASDSTLSGIVAKLVQRYLDAQSANTGTKLAIASGFRALGHQSPEILRDYGPQLAPLAFLATAATKQGEEVAESEKAKLEELRGVWDEVWNELAPGEEGGIRLYRSELIRFSIGLVKESSAWVHKAQAAACLARIVTSLKTSLQQSEFDEILETLLSAMSGRTWDGKEAVLEATRLLFHHSVTGNDQIVIDDDRRSKISAALMAECGKRVVSYRSEAVLCSGDVSLAMGVPSFPHLLALLQPLLQREGGSVVEEEEGWEELGEMERKTREIAFAVPAFTALGKALRANFSKSHLHLWIRLAVDALPRSYWKIQAAITEQLLPLIKNGEFAKSVEADDLFVLLGTLVDVHGVASQGSLREGVEGCVVGLGAVWVGEPGLSGRFPPAEMRERLRAFFSEPCLVPDAATAVRQSCARLLA